MPMLSKYSQINLMSETDKRFKWVLLALPLAITAGCAGPKDEIIDYTISKAEYQALMAPAPAAEEMAPSAATEELIASLAAESEDQLLTDLVAEATSEPAALSALSAEPQALAEPVMAAATPAPLAEPTMAAALPALDEPAMPSLAASELNTAELNTAELNSLDMNPATTSAANEYSASMTGGSTQYETQSGYLDNDGIPMEPLKEPQLAQARSIDIDRLGFTPSIYATVGLGVSRMNPDTSAAVGFDALDKTDPSGQVAFGVDLARFLSLEMHSGDYGSTSLTPSGRVNYHVHGVSALFYAGRKLDRFRRRGLNAYARIGFNQIENSPIGNSPFVSQASNHGSFGLGAEFTTRIGLGLRADVTAYDGDVQYGQVGLLYRLASKPSIIPKLAAATAEVAPPSAPAYKPYPELNAAMPNAAPATNQSAPRADNFSLPGYTTEYTSSSNGDDCYGLNGTLSNVTFMTGSAQLTLGATQALDNIAATLRDCGDRQIVVSAHTDNAGSATANDQLSKMRARTVATYLARNGVDMNRMRAVAYGESQPIASNATAEGRSSNRRVELEVR